MIVFTRDTNRVKVDIDGTKRMFLDPNLQVTGVGNESVVYFAEGPLDNQRVEDVLRFPVASISGRPNDDAQDVAEWLSDTFFFGNNYGSGGGSFPVDYANSGNQATIIAAINTQTVKMSKSDIIVEFDSRAIVKTVGGGLDGKIDYIAYLTGGRFGTEVARKTLYYDGNFKLQYTEVT